MLLLFSQKVELLLLLFSLLLFSQKVDLFLSLLFSQKVELLLLLLFSQKVELFSSSTKSSLQLHFIQLVFSPKQPMFRHMFRAVLQCSFESSTYTWVMYVCTSLKQKLASIE